MSDLLRLTQWLSPAFPTGAFAYSHGLETAIADGRIHDAASFEAWLDALIRYGSGATDAVLLCRTLAGEDITANARALSASAERWEETLAQGTAFAATLRAMDMTAEDGPLPVVVGCAARPFSLARVEIASLYLHSFTSALVTVGVKSIPLGQAAGQGVLSRLTPVITETAEWAATATLDDIATSTFHADLAAMAHERLDVRLYRS
ncbi:MAG: urease accessory protein UreF [Shimia sp.]